MRFRKTGLACAVAAFTCLSVAPFATADEFSVPDTAKPATSSSAAAGSDSAGLGLSPTGAIGIEDSTGVSAAGTGVSNTGMFSDPNTGTVTPYVPATGTPSTGGYYSGAYFEDGTAPVPGDGPTAPPIEVPMDGGMIDGGIVETYPMDGGVTYPAVPPAGAYPMEGYVDGGYAGEPVVRYAEPYAESYAPPAPVAAAPVITRSAPSSNAVGTSGNCQPNCGQKRDDCCFAVDRCGRRYGCTTIRAEGLFSYLNSPEGFVGEPAFGLDAGVTQWEWDELDYEPAFGGRAFVKHCLGPLEWIEVGGTYYGTRDDESTSTGVFGFAPPDAFAGGGHQPIGHSNPVVGTLYSEAEAFGAEASFISEMHCSGCYRWDWLIGARYLQFNEEARVDFAQAPISFQTAPNIATGFVASDVENTFIGLQIGAVMHWELSPTFELQASLKALAGNLNRDIEVSDNNVFSGGAHSAQAEEDEIVFGADIDVGARWRLTSRLTLTAGYNLLMLDGVGRANDVMDFAHANSGAVQARHETDQLIIHSVFVGLEVNF